MSSNGAEKLSEKYGARFQIKAISSILSDKKFLERIIDILDPEYFDGRGKQWIVSKILDFYEEYREIPKLEYFQSEIQSVASDSLQASILENLRKVWEKKKSPDLDWVRDNFLEFCKQQKVRKTVENCIPLLDTGEYGTIRSKLNDALSAGASREVGHDYMEEVNERMEGVVRDTIPTGWPVLDDKALDGGLAPGEIGVLMGATGAGKTWALSHIGAKAMEQDYKVVHYTLELSEKQTGFRYDSIFSGHAPNKIPENKEDVKEALSYVPGNVSIQYWPTNSATTQTLYSHLERMEVVKWKPDLIILDYADLLRPLKTQQEDSAYGTMGNIYKDLRRLSGELEVPIWTVTQTQRQAVREKVVKKDRVADSWQKAMNADFMASIARTDTNKLTDTARIHVAKSRFGPDGKTFPAMMSTSSGSINVFDPDSEKGKRLLAKMNKSEEQAQREEISQAWQEFKLDKSLSNGKAKETSTSEF